MWLVIVLILVIVIGAVELRGVAHLLLVLLHLLLQVDPNLSSNAVSFDFKKYCIKQYQVRIILIGWGIINTYAAVQSLITGVNPNQTPEDYYILQNYPNPFNPSTKIRFAIPEKSQVRLALYDVLGRELVTILDEEINPGIKEVELNGSNLSSGIYLVRMITDNYQQTIKITLLK